MLAVYVVWCMCRHPIVMLASCIVQPGARTYVRTGTLASHARSTVCSGLQFVKLVNEKALACMTVLMPCYGSWKGMAWLLLQQAIIARTIRETRESCRLRNASNRKVFYGDGE